MMIDNYGPSFSVSQSKQAGSSAIVAETSGKSLPPESNRVDTVTISEAARSDMLDEMRSGQFMDFTGDNGPYKLGLMALGSSTINDWSAKGLELSDEAVIAAGEAFNDGFKSMVEVSGASMSESGGLTLNKYQIVMNAQKVPDWFTSEYETVLSSMENKEAKAAFEKGDLFFSSKPSSENSNALATYASVGNTRR